MLRNLCFNLVDLQVQLLGFFINFLYLRFQILLLTGSKQLHQVSLLSLTIFSKIFFSCFQALAHFLKNLFLFGGIWGSFDSVHVVLTHLRETRVALFIKFGHTQLQLCLPLLFQTSWIDSDFFDLVTLLVQVVNLTLQVSDLVCLVFHVLCHNLYNLLVKFVALG